MAENLKYITFERIDINSTLDVFTDGFPKCGSVVIFEGRVRADKIDDAVVEKIIYESYIEMAENTSNVEFISILSKVIYFKFSAILIILLLLVIVKLFHDQQLQN